MPQARPSQAYPKLFKLLKLSIKVLTYRFKSFIVELLPYVDTNIAKPRKGGKCAEGTNTILYINFLCFAQHIMIDKEFFNSTLHLKGLSTKSLADLANLPEDTIKNIRYGRVKDVKCSTLEKLADALNCSTDELLGREQINLTEFNMLQTFRRLSLGSQKFILSVLHLEDTLSESYNECSPFKKEIIVFKPTGYMEDSMIFDSSSFAQLDARDYIRKYGPDKIHCGLYVTSNSLSPAYYQEDILLICNRPPRSGDTAVFIHQPTGKIYIRKYFPGNITTLEPINNFGKNIYIDSRNPAALDEWHIFGYIVTRIREPNLFLEDSNSFLEEL